MRVRRVRGHHLRVVARRFDAGEKRVRVAHERCRERRADRRRRRDRGGRRGGDAVDFCFARVVGKDASCSTVTLPKLPLKRHDSRHVSTRLLYNDSTVASRFPDPQDDRPSTRRAKKRRAVCFIPFFSTQTSIALFARASQLGPVRPGDRPVGEFAVLHGAVLEVRARVVDPAVARAPLPEPGGDAPRPHLVAPVHDPPAEGGEAHAQHRRGVEVAGFDDDALRQAPTRFVHHREEDHLHYVVLRHRGKRPL
mmetsp:Transcript_9464/g.39710  ORF Transcript_9464/g.39710 Transcript_9464/m.39710 type:complete len:252 (-) Transcript_9464:1672-2427(-)